MSVLRDANVYVSNLRTRESLGLGKFSLHLVDIKRVFFFPSANMPPLYFGLFPFMKFLVVSCAFCLFFWLNFE